MEKTMKYAKIILMSIPVDDLRELFRSVIKEELYFSNQKKQEKELMNFNECCEFLDLSRSGLNKLKAEGRIPFRKLGRRIYFDKADVKNAMKDSNYHKYNKLFKND